MQFFHCTSTVIICRVLCILATQGAAKLEELQRPQACPWFYLFLSSFFITLFVLIIRHGIKMGFMSAFVKASAYALTQQPTVNAVIDGTDIIYRDYVDISVAVATPKVC